MNVLVVVPTYNEVDNLGPLLDQLLSLGPDYHVLVVDDASPDGTGALADTYHLRFPDRVAVLHREGKLGLATAYLSGFSYGIQKGYDCLVQMDADFSHDPQELPKLIARTSHADVVIGSRYIAGGRTVNWPWHRRMLSCYGSLYARKVLGLGINDLTGGYKAFRREALARLDFSQIGATGYGYQLEVTYRLYQSGATILEIPITFRDRQAGKSKMSPQIFFEALLLVWKLRFTPPLATPVVAERHS